MKLKCVVINKIYNKKVYLKITPVRISGKERTRKKDRKKERKKEKKRKEMNVFPFLFSN
jgi:hypothetical protein